MLKAFISIGLMLFCFLAKAQMLPMSDEQLVSQSQEIVQGEVISKEVRWVNNNQFIYTFVKIRVDKALSGDTPNGSIVTIAIPGGYDPVKDIGVNVSNQASFESGEEVVVFLEKAEGDIDAINYDVLKTDVPNFESLKRVTGYEQGKQIIYTDKNSHRRMIFKPNSNQSLELNTHKLQLQQEIQRVQIQKGLIPQKK